MSGGWQEAIFEKIPDPRAMGSKVGWWAEMGLTRGEEERDEKKKIGKMVCCCWMPENAKNRMDVEGEGRNKGVIIKVTKVVMCGGGEGDGEGEEGNTERDATKAQCVCGGEDKD